MLKNLGVIHFIADSANQTTNGLTALESAYRKLENFSTGVPIILKTCQRTLLIYYFASPHIPALSLFEEYFTGEEAYRFLLQVLCGLQSKIVGENEIVNQFKTTYQEYLKQTERHPQLLLIMEKLFKDAKMVRTHHLKEIGQLSYAGISRKIVQNHESFANAPSLLLFGSGAIAEEVIGQFKKRYPITICARNLARLETLKNKWSGLESLHQDFNSPELQKIYCSFPLIINTIGHNETVFSKEMLDEWHKTHQGRGLFIDLGPEIVVNTTLTKNEGVYRLKDLFSHGAILDLEKRKKIQEAQNKIDELAQERMLGFPMNFPFSWEELQMA